MADTITIKTTSSTSLDETETQQKQNSSATIAASLPRQQAEVQILSKLATNLTESYQLVKQRQQKYNELNTKQHESSTLALPEAQTAWQEVCSNKNKLKRKKKLSSSLTSVSDSVNQEKRTRIEGMQLNCRGRLAVAATSSAPATPTNAHSCVRVLQRNNTDKHLATKPPLPPVPKKEERTANASAIQTPQITAAGQAVKVPPPRLKRKLQENMQTIQKLNALTDQLRLEINELKSSLTTERGAVRVLRAQNESETRKWKNEVKKLQNTTELLKKTMPNAAKKLQDTATSYADNLPAGSAAVASNTSSTSNHEVQRLTNEIIALKEANKALEEKKMINCDADRRKTADMRELRDSYEIRLTQLTKSAKTEISRLLEEIKTKERNIGQLKKELQHNSSRNATNTFNTTNKTTNNNIKNNKTQLQNKRQEPKQNKIEKVNKNKTTNETTENKQNATKAETKMNMAQNSNEMKQLKDLELINNNRNLQQEQENNCNNINNINKNNNNNNNSLHRTTKIFNTTHNSKLKIEIEEAPKASDLLLQCTTNNSSSNNNNNNKNIMLTETATNLECLLNNNNNNVQITTTTKMITTEKEHHSLPHDLLTERFIGQHNEAHEYRVKDHNSDSDSALSSAPPSISPQPPPSGMESADIWQTLRNYAQDIEKLQKDLELMQTENVDLRQELHAAKQQIMDTEKSALTQSDSNSNLQDLVLRIRYLEEQEHQLQSESDELREQNELLEFRILELEDSSDKWSLQTPSTPSATSLTNNISSSSSLTTAKDVWSCGQTNSKTDPMSLLFGSINHNNHDAQLDSGITSPQHQPHMQQRLKTLSPCELNLFEDMNHAALRQRLINLQKRLPLDEQEKECLQQLLALLQQLDVLSSNSSSGQNSLNTHSSSSDEHSSLELVKSRISDYTASYNDSSNCSSARSAVNTSSSSGPPSTSTKSPTAASSNARIVATVLPYNSNISSTASHPNAPTNTPTESPRKTTRAAWQCNSLSESGVFVESDFLSDASDSHQQEANNKQQIDSSPKHLQYYQQRLELLERKVLIYESSGDQQAKRLAERLQREIQLEQELRELRERVDSLEVENASLDEEKCEFEEAENDTRLRLQRLEIELEILSQRNVELEMSREALSAKYKDCRSECLLLRDDLSVSETQLRHLEEDKQIAKENFEFLHSVLPVLMLYNTLLTIAQQQQQQQHYIVQEQRDKPVHLLETVPQLEMGNTHSQQPTGQCERSSSLAQFEREERICGGGGGSVHTSSGACQERELHYLKEEIKCLRHQIKELNSRHYEAMESADSHWVDLEREYKDREEAYRAKEFCLKQKINRLQDCVRDDARAANEKIMQQEEQEKELRTCLLRISKELRDSHEEQQQLQLDSERLREQYEQLKEQQQPLKDAIDIEKKHNKSLNDELNFMRKLQQETENHNQAEMECLRTQQFELKKEFLHIEVTNSELKEEVATLEQQLIELQKNEQECADKIRCLQDEVRSKEEIAAKLEKRLERSEGYSLAQELDGSPSKRFKREDIKDLQSASKGLGSALRNMRDCERTIPSHQKFQSVARDVKKLADTLLGGSLSDDEEEVSNKEKKDDDNAAGDDAAPARSSTDVEARASERGSEERRSSAVAAVDAVEPVNAAETADALEPNEGVLTVAMAFLPEFTIDESMLPSSSHIKKQICEVPSELRKLKDSQAAATSSSPYSTEDDEGLVLEEISELSESLPPKRKNNKKRRFRRNVGKSIALRSSTSLRARVRRIVSCLNAHRSLEFHDASDIDITQSEILQRNISYDSFHSLKDEQLDAPLSLVKTKSVDACTETDVQHSDKETETKVEHVEHSVQANDDVFVQQLLDIIPSTGRDFIHLLQVSTPAANMQTRKHNELLRKQWETDVEFREGLEILTRFAGFGSSWDDSDDSFALETYETFVNAMTCIHVLREIYKPIKIALLQQIEEQINEQLMNFHSRKMESEFYCTVYYPVKRQVPLNVNESVIN